MGYKAGRGEAIVQSGDLDIITLGEMKDKIEAEDDAHFEDDDD